MATILIVEDEIFTRDLAGMFLEDVGHLVLLAGTVEEALPFLQSDQPIDALFTDIYLKTAAFGGCELARMAVAMRPTLRVLYTTGNTTTPELLATFVLGSHFLCKPYSPEQLQWSVHGMLAN